MTLHYHGTPITPRSELVKLSGRNFCVSYAAPYDVRAVHDLGQSVMLDNGAFSFWRQDIEVDDEFWAGYYDWCEEWLRPTTWAVIPDVIDGDVGENDYLVRVWPFGGSGAPVWHLNEPITRLLTLASEWPRVCIGSAGDYAVLQTPQWHRRMHVVFNELHRANLEDCWIHMLRGMALSNGPYPFASLDSTDIARNHNRPRNDVAQMALRWDSMQCPARWEFREQLGLEAA